VTIDVLTESVTFLDAFGNTVTRASRRMKSVYAAITSGGRRRDLDQCSSTAGGIASTRMILDDGANSRSAAPVRNNRCLQRASRPAARLLRRPRNDRDGQIDEADENVFRFYVERGASGFAKGTLTIAFLPGSWFDDAGNPGTAGDEPTSVQLIEALKTDPNSAQATGKVFYIEISGGFKLQGLGFADEPIVDIRGRVLLQFGDYEVPFDEDENGTIETGETTTVSRFSLDASGTIKIIELGNIGSVAARFIFQTGDTPSGNPEFWGVAKIQANLEFLEPMGVFIEGAATLQINTTPTVKTETIALEGIPGDLIEENLALGTSSLATSPFGGVDLPESWASALDPHITEVLAEATVQTVIVGKKWKLVTEAGPAYFLSLDIDDGKLDLRSEAQTFELAAESFSIGIAGGVWLYSPGGNDTIDTDDPAVKQGDDVLLAQLTGGFFLKITPDRFEVFRHRHSVAAEPACVARRWACSSSTPTSRRLGCRAWRCTSASN
jgi:hypothetical protein